MRKPVIVWPLKGFLSPFLLAHRAIAEVNLHKNSGISWGEKGGDVNHFLFEDHHFVLLFVVSQGCQLISKKESQEQSLSSRSPSESRRCSYKWSWPDPGKRGSQSRLPVYGESHKRQRRSKRCVHPWYYPLEEKIMTVIGNHLKSIDDLSPIIYR